MTIPQMLEGLENIYKNGPYYPSRAQIFTMSLQDGYITEEEYEKAKAFYSKHKLWNYTGD